MECKVEKRSYKVASMVDMAEPNDDPQAYNQEG